LALSSAIERKLELQGALLSLSGVEIIVNARQSVAVTASKRSLIATLAVVLGAMLGIFIVFMVEFGVIVRKQLSETGHK
jgi:uncharacterized protein involved in exopolysaccharide biosynthesis